jgi:SsrA-binding protein
MSKQSKKPGNLIVNNRKARFNYHIETQFEAGLELRGWEVKSLREGKAQISESYISLKQGEVWLINSHFSPLNTTAKHIESNPIRERKCLLNRKEINQLRKNQDIQGYTIVPLNLHWKNGKAKLQIAIAKGKKLFDKRAAAKDRDWNRQKQRKLSDL